jgi:hypothetical protein
LFIKRSIFELITNLFFFAGKSPFGNKVTCRVTLLLRKNEIFSNQGVNQLINEVGELIDCYFTLPINFVDRQRENK